MSSSSPSPKPDEPTPPRSTGPTSSPPPPAPSPGSPGAAPRSTTPDRNGPTPPGRPVAAPGERDEKTAEEPRPARTAEYLAKTRAAAAWFFTAVALIVMVLLIILILQNEDRVQVSYLGLEAWLPLGVALLIAAVVGGALVAIVGVIRLTQLRRHAKRVQRLEAEQRKR